MRELVEAIAHNLLVACVGAFVGIVATAHATIVLSRTLRFIAGELREQYRAMRRELEEWRKFFRGP